MEAHDLDRIRAGGGRRADGRASVRDGKDAIWPYWQLGCVSDPPLILNGGSLTLTIADIRELAAEVLVLATTVIGSGDIALLH